MAEGGRWEGRFAGCWRSWRMSTATGSPTWRWGSRTWAGWWCSPGADGTRLRTLRAPSPQAGASFGAALAGVGDVNGDGVPDLAVGAPCQDLEDGLL